MVRIIPGPCHPAAPRKRGAIGKAYCNGSLWAECQQGPGGAPSYFPAPVILRKVDILSNSGRWDEAEAIGRRTLERARDLGLDAAAAECGFRLGEVLRFKGEYDRSLEFLSRSADLFGGLADGGGRARSIGAMGGVHGERGDYRKAIDCFTLRKEWAEEAGDKLEQGISWGNLGVMYAEQRMFGMALECYGRQRALAEECGDLMGVSMAVGNTGNIHLYQGEYGQAVECFQAQRCLATRLGDKRSLCALSCNLGLLFKRQARLEEARTCFEEGIRLSREIGYSRALSVSTGNLGTVHQLLGHWALASDFLRSHLDLSQELGDKQGMASALANLSRVHAVQDDFVRSLEAIVQAVAVARDSGLADLLPVLLNMQAEILLDACGWQRAGPVIEEAARLAVERKSGEQQGVSAMLAAALRLRGGDRSAAGELERIASGDPCEQTRLGACFWLYRCLGGVPHLEEARRLTERLYSATGDVEFKFNLEKLESGKLHVSLP